MTAERPRRGRSIRLSAPRRLINDLLIFARRVPTVPVQRTIDISRVMAIRNQAANRIGWCALFTKAFALVCREMPVLRRAYLRFPWPRLYEHPFSVASIAVERDYFGEPGVFFIHLPKPEDMGLPDLEKTLQRLQTEAVDQAFRFPLAFSRVPGPLRRFLWWWIMNVRGSRKAQFLGTFGVSVYSSLGAESLHQISPLTCALNYGVISPEGIVAARIVYDHRVMDGATIARALHRLESVMNNEIVAELKKLG